MEIKDNKIIRATKNELFEIYLDRGFDDIMSFEDYVRNMVRHGCELVDDEEEQWQK